MNIKKVLVSMFLGLLALGANAQVYEGATSPADSWVTAPGINVRKDYGGKDAVGNYLYDPRYIVNGSFVKGPAFRAARLLKVDPDLFVQYGDYTCAQFGAQAGLSTSACPSIALAPPPPNPPIDPPPGPPTTGKVTTIVVVPVRYQSPPSSDPNEIKAYNDTIGRVTQANLQIAFSKIVPWWAAESYGKASAVVTVLPAIDVQGNKPCDFNGVATDARRAIPVGMTYDVLGVVTPYNCWQGQGVGGGGVAISWGTQPEGAAIVLHEAGHAMGLLHNANVINGTFVEYGSGFEIMGAGHNCCDLLHLNSDHKNKLGWTTPMACASTTLRSTYLYPDAIRCGDFFMDYWPDWNYVIIHKREFHSGSQGGADSIDYAILMQGQSYRLDIGKTVTHVGRGVVTIQ